VETCSGLVREEVSATLLTSEFTAITGVECLELFCVLEYLDVTWEKRIFAGTSSKADWVRKEVSATLLTSECFTMLGVECLELFCVLKHLDVT